jgi:hypothetical protein
MAIMFKWLEPEFDNPPRTEQFEAWATTRSFGRTRYLGLGIIRITLLYLVIWLLVKVIVHWLLHSEFDLSGVPLFPIAPLIGWWAFRIRWKNNEKLFLSSKKPN